MTVTSKGEGHGLATEKGTCNSNALFLKFTDEYKGVCSMAETFHLFPPRATPS